MILKRFFLSFQECKEYSITFLHFNWCVRKIVFTCNYIRGYWNCAYCLFLIIPFSQNDLIHEYKLILLIVQQREWFIWCWFHYYPLVYWYTCDYWKPRKFCFHAFKWCTWWATTGILTRKNFRMNFASRNLFYLQIITCKILGRNSNTIELRHSQKFTFVYIWYYKCIYINGNITIPNKRQWLSATEGG